MTDNPALAALLKVQAHDTRLDQLRHQLETLPERLQRDQAAALLVTLEADHEATAADRDDLRRQQKRVDDEVELLKDKRKGFDTKLYGGTVSNPRELQDLQDEIEALGRRIRVLEDDELEIMEQVEPVEEKFAQVELALAAARSGLDDAETRLTVADAELRAALDAETGLRSESAGPVAPDLMATYETLRAGGGGVGIARIVGAQCGGCHLGLSAMEAARMRKLSAEAIAHCEECGRILVP